MLQVHPLFHLALADLILASLWFSGACFWFHNKHADCFYLDVFGEVGGFLVIFFFSEKKKSHYNLTTLEGDKSQQEYGIGGISIGGGRKEDRKQNSHSQGEGGRN